MQYTKDEILEQFKNHMKVKDMSKVYENPTKQYLTYCENSAISYDNISEIDICFLEGFILYLKGKQLKNGTIDNHIKAIRLFYKFLVDRKLIDGKVIEELYKVKLHKPEKVIKDYITKEELDELIEMAWGWYRAMDMYKLKAILYFMFFTGVRIGELINLKREHITLETKEALIKIPTKGREERYIFFTKEVRKLVDQYFSTEPEETNAFNVTRNQVISLIQYLRQFTHKKITPHTLRHSFAHYLALNEIDIKVAQKLLGHKNLASTEIYYDPTKETVKKIYHNKLG